MATRAAANSAPSERSGLASISLEKIREKIQWFHGERNIDGMRDEAINVTNTIELSEHYFKKVEKVNRDLREKLDVLTAHEHYAVAITDVSLNGSVKVEVAGLRRGRVRVAVHPDVDTSTLLIGATGLVAREGNCLLEVISPTGRWNAVGVFERYIDSGDRMLLRDREATVAVDIAHQLRGTTFKKGDLVGFDRETAGMAYERLDPANREHLFDENVTDDFSLLGGLEKEVVRIKRLIDFRVRFPELAAKYDQKNRYGILLHGKPGNGKTRIARCCAGYVRTLFPDLPCRFMHISGSSDYSMWLGQSEQNIIERFSAAREAAKDGPVVMCWDEIDAIAKRRGSDHGSSAPDRILSTLLSEIDGVVQLNNVIMLFATNRPNILDPGLLRPGRIDVKIEIPSPNCRAAEAILRGYINRVPLAALHRRADEAIGPLLSRLFAPNGDYAEVARVKLNDGRRMPVAGRELVSGAMLEVTVSAAALSAAVREAEGGKEGVLEEDLSLALETQMNEAVSMLAPSTVKDYVKSIPQDAQPIAVEPMLRAPSSTFVRPR